MRAEVEPALRNGLLFEDENGLRFASELILVESAAQYIVRTEGELLSSTPKGCFERLDEIFGKEIGKQDRVSGHVLALLHNAKQIDAYSWARKALEEGASIYDVVHVMEGAVVHLENAIAEPIFEFFASHYESNDIARGLLHPKLEAWFTHHPDVACAIKHLHENHPDERSMGLYGCSLHGLILNDFRAGFPLVTEASKSSNLTIAGPALNVLGVVDYHDSSRRAALNETIQICTEIIRTAGHVSLGRGFRALSHLVALDEIVIVGLLEEAARTGRPEVHHALSEFLWMEDKSIGEKEWFWSLTLHLASVKTDCKDILRNIDCMLSHWMRDQSRGQRVVNFLNTWISYQSADDFNEGGIEIYFPSTFHRLANQPAVLSHALTGWLLHDDTRYPLVARKLVSHLRVAGIESLELEHTIIGELSEDEIRFVLRRILGFIYGDDAQIRLVFSLIRTRNAKERTFEHVTSVLQDLVGYDYPYQTIEYLKERQSSTNETAEVKVLCNEIVMELQGRLDALNALPDLKEYRASSIKTYRFAKERRRQMNEAMDKASEHSIWQQITTTIPLKAGRRTFQTINGQYTEPMELKEVSHSAARPRSETSDPLGADRQRRLFRRAKKGDL